MNEFEAVGRLLREALPDPMFQSYLREATVSVEQELALEDKGWINLTTTSGEGILAATRILAVKESRVYYYTDPMATQAIRLWTDYTFGKGMVWQAEDDSAQKVLEAFWDNPMNRTVLGAKGQRKSSDKLLVDGEIFFAIFLGVKDEATIRRIDPLEITEFITDIDDIENVRYYRRDWTDQLNKTHISYYRSTTNVKDESAKDANGKDIQKTEEALVYHLPFRTLGQRGTGLLLPAHFYLKYNKKFIASRVAIMLALTRFAWRTKVKGGQTAVDNIKGKTHDKTPQAASILLENLGSDTTPIKADSSARNAYQDGRMIKLMISAAVGLPEQYFGDISIGNLATAKTAELPVTKMFQSNQAVWADAYQDIDEVVLAHSDIPPKNWYVDRVFPPIAPADVALVADAIVKVINVMPEFASSPDVQQVALMILGINDPQEVIDNLPELAERNPSIALVKVLKQFREAIKDYKG